jgi:hypothetical protein
MHRRVSFALVAAMASLNILAAAAPQKRGPSLEVTMKYIQDTLNDIGLISFVATYQQPTDGNNGGLETYHYTHRDRFSNFQADKSACRIDYHVSLNNDGSKVDQDRQIPLADAEDVVVEPEEKYLSDITAASGNPAFVATSTSPAITALVVRFRHQRITGAARLLFTDADRANHAAKAITHAIELCGGGSTDPF